MVIGGQASDKHDYGMGNDANYEAMMVFRTVEMAVVAMTFMMVVMTAKDEANDHGGDRGDVGFRTDAFRLWS